MTSPFSVTATTPQRVIEIGDSIPSDRVWQPEYLLDAIAHTLCQYTINNERYALWMPDGGEEPEQVASAYLGFPFVAKEGGEFCMVFLMEVENFHFLFPALFHPPR